MSSEGYNRTIIDSDGILLNDAQQNETKGEYNGENTRLISKRSGIELKRGSHHYPCHILYTRLGGFWFSVLFDARERTRVQKYTTNIYCTVQNNTVLQFPQLLFGATHVCSYCRISFRYPKALYI